MKKKNVRLNLGYLMGIIFLIRAKPTPKSFLIGALVIILGESIRFIGAGTLMRYKGVVTRTGIYAHTRNPLYIGSFLLGTGACIISRDPIFLTLFLALFIPVYYRVIGREEAWLATQYGEEFESYRRSVPKIIPRRLNIPEILRHTTRARAFNNMEGKTLLGVAAVLVVMALKLAFS